MSKVFATKEAAVEDGVIRSSCVSFGFLTAGFRATILTTFEASEQSCDWASDEARITVGAVATSMAAVMTDTGTLTCGRCWLHVLVRHLSRLAKFLLLHFEQVQSNRAAVASGITTAGGTT